MSWIARQPATTRPGWLSGPARRRRGSQDERPQAVRGHGASGQTAPGEHDRPALADHRHGSKGVLQGYNAQAAATAGQVVVAAEVTATTNDQPHFVPIATAVIENLADAGAATAVGALVADAGYWTAANGTTDIAGANVLIATKKSSWRNAAKPDDDKLAVLAKVNRGELSQRKAGEMLGVSYTWVRDMTKRYFGRDGQRLSDRADPEPDEWIPVIERVNRGEISKRAAEGPAVRVRQPDQRDARPRPRRSHRTHDRPQEPWTPNSPNQPTPRSTSSAAKSSNRSSGTSKRTSPIGASPAAGCPPSAANGG